MAKKEEVIQLPINYYEKHLYKVGYHLIAGVDEVGRGPLAGPVVAAAVILPNNFFPQGIKDSKKLTVQERKTFYYLIQKEAVSFGLGIVNERVIDYLNIKEATLKAMQRAVLNLNPSPDIILVDGFPISELDMPQLAIIQGDNLSVSIAAASIVAKVTRDHLMDIYDKVFPQYQFFQNKGYGTGQHLQFIRRFGKCIIHRKTFQVRNGKGKD